MNLIHPEGIPKLSTIHYPLSTGQKYDNAKKT